MEFSSLLKTIDSFVRLATAPVTAIKAERLRVIPRDSQSFETLAAQSTLEYDAANHLHLLNRPFPAGEISKLDNLKNVTLK